MHVQERGDIREVRGLLVVAPGGAAAACALRDALVPLLREMVGLAEAEISIDLDAEISSELEADAA